MITAIDTNVLVYFVENNRTYGEQAYQLLAKSLEQGEVTISVIGVAEFFAHTPTKLHLDKYALLKDKITFIEVDETVAEVAGRLRQQNKTLQFPDTLHIASALVRQADYFVTNDQQLLQLRKVDGLAIKPLA